MSSNTAADDALRYLDSKASEARGAATQCRRKFQRRTFEAVAAAYADAARAVRAAQPRQAAARARQETKR